MVTTPDRIVARFESLTAMIALISTALSGLGLLVGGIGVRKALGAPKQDIIFQFLMEAVTQPGRSAGRHHCRGDHAADWQAGNIAPLEVPPFAPVRFPWRSVCSSAFGQHTRPRSWTLWMRCVTSNP